MGVDYLVWIIPQQREFRASAEQVAGLANALRDGGWVPKPEAAGQKSKAIELLPGNGSGGNKQARIQDFESAPFTPSWVEFHSPHEFVMDWHVQNLSDACVEYPFVF